MQGKQAKSGLTKAQRKREKRLRKMERKAWVTPFGIVPAPKGPGPKRRQKQGVRPQASVRFDAGQTPKMKQQSMTRIHLERDSVLLDNWAQPQFSGTLMMSSSTVTGAAQNVTSGALVCPPLVLSPFLLDNGRLAVMASLFQEWRPRRMTLRYQPTVGEFNNGSLIFCASKDPSWTPYNSSTGLSQYSAAASLKLMSEQARRAQTHIAEKLSFDMVRPGDWKGDVWLSSTSSTAAGLLARLNTAGICWIAIEGLPTNSSGTALTSSPGFLTLDYEIEFRGPTDNPLARTVAEVVNQLELRSLTGVTAGSALQFEFFNNGATSLLLGGELAMVTLGADLTTVAGGTVMARNQPIFLAKVGTNAYYNAYFSLFDAVAQNTNVLTAAVTTTANVAVDVSSYVPLANLST